MSEHTQGPWYWIGPRIKSMRAQCIVARLPYETDCVGDEPPEQLERWDADARLIAAAPELLEALQEALDDWDFDEPDCVRVEWADKARAAIAKAKGQPERSPPSHEDQIKLT